jgi:hypothetical protein
MYIIVITLRHYTVVHDFITDTENALRGFCRSVVVTVSYSIYTHTHTYIVGLVYFGERSV